MDARRSDSPSPLVGEGAGGWGAGIAPAAATPGAPASAPTAVAPATPEFHIVQPGEVLSTIASKYNTTVENLAELNDIQNVDSIRVGQRLRLVPAGQ